MTATADINIGYSQTSCLHMLADGLWCTCVVVMGWHKQACFVPAQKCLHGRA